MLSSEISTDFLSNPSLISTLPGPLAAPVGWRSQVIDSNSPLSTNIGINTNNYGGYRHASTLIHNNTGYTNEGVHHDRQWYLSADEQRNIVNMVEHQNPPPLLVRKTLPNNEVTYKQNVAVRYLRPPTPPPPGPLIIREVRAPQPPPPPPIKIRQRPARPPTPPPIILREQPPLPPPQIPAKIVEKVLPAPAPPPPRVVIERYGVHPPKPADVVIERWLPYKQSGPRRVLVERAPPSEIISQEPNLLVLHDSPQARVHRQYINEGVVCADPMSYLQRYGAEIDPWHSKTRYARLVGEATHAVPPPPISPIYDYGSPYVEEYRRSPSPYLASTWERTRVVSPIPRSSSYHYGSSYYDSPYYYSHRTSPWYEYDRPYHYCNQSSSRYGYDIPSHYCNRYSPRYGYDVDRYYDDYPRYYDSYRSPSWNYYYRGDPYYRSSSSYYPSDTIHVHSENEFHHVLSDLTHGRVPPNVGLY